MRKLKHAIFIEPVGLIKDLILSSKLAVRRVQPDAAYLSHPPHLTVLFGDYGPAANWLSLLGRRISTCRSFMVTTSDWHVFANDTLAGGGETLVVNVAWSDSISRLQGVCAETLAPFANEESKVCHPLAAIEPFASSIRQYGSAFVGDHWIPHFSIASLAVPGRTEVLRQIRKTSAQGSFRVEGVSVWSVDDDQHRKIASFTLET